MRKKFCLSTALVFACAAFALAHPLGNFSVNHFSQIEITESQIKVRAVLDKAEIPTFQESQVIDANKDGAMSQDELDAYAEKLTPEYAANLLLTVDGQAIELHPATKKIGLVEGSANLPILRLEWDLTGDLPKMNFNESHRVVFENKNNSERIGWNEIVVARVAGVNIFDSTAFGSGVTNELKEYPEASINAPLGEREAEFSFTGAPLAPSAKPLQNRDGKPSAPVAKDPFAELIRGDLTPAIILFGLLAAFGFGAAHALSPGHGKTVVGAYLVGSRGTLKHAIFLGATVTVTHTLSVFALGLVALFASKYISPERFFPVSSFISGLMILVIGLSLFKNRLAAALGHKTGAGDLRDDVADDEQKVIEAEHAHDDLRGNFTHTHGGSTHSHMPPPARIGWRSLLALGVSGGLIPCPSALVLMLAAISGSRIGYGLILTLVFSFGLAATLTGVGIAFLYAGKLFDSPSLSGNRLVKILPVASAFVIACVGAVICYNSF